MKLTDFCCNAFEKLWKRGVLDHGYWVSDGDWVYFEFHGDSDKDKLINYCPYCGKKVLEVVRSDWNDKKS